MSGLIDDSKRSYQPAILSLLGEGIILLILLLDPAFTTLNWGAVGNCRFSQSSPSDHFFGPTTALAIGRNTGDYHLFWGLALVGMLTICAGFIGHRRLFWLNILAVGAGFVYTIILLGWIFNTIGCTAGTDLSQVEKLVAVLGTIFASLMLILGHILLLSPGSSLDSYQNESTGWHK